MPENGYQISFTATGEVGGVPNTDESKDQE